MHIDRLDYPVLTVKGINATCAFCEKALGMTLVTFGASRRALQFGRQKINLHQVGNKHDPSVRNTAAVWVAVR